ncbi:restriction endonuclease subunit S [Pseudodesulfovibrio profundus]|uniref:restriction endonuclease subunit S n=1 Tax=Pseudodesulfovibrio profundus TaxID=57320 RepID=UPI0012FF9F70
MLTPQVTYYRVKDQSKLSNKFLKYYFDSADFQSTLGSWAGGGSTRAYLSITNQHGLPIILPPLKTQKAIAHILGTLDDKIELNRRMNETLEAMAQALFKSWFVDFDPVKSKMEGRQPEGMDAATAALFPDKLVESELGLIPEGWKVGSLGDLAKLNAKSWTKKRHPETVQYVDLANTKNGVIEQVVEYDFEEAPSRARRALFEGDTIVGTVRPGNRSYAYIGPGDTRLTGSTGFAVLTPQEKLWRELVYIAATCDESIERLAHLADGAAYPAVKPNIVAETAVVIPDKSVGEAFHQIVSSFFAQTSAQKKQNIALVQSRDALLPKLISGELSVAEVEKQLESVL